MYPSNCSAASSTPNSAANFCFKVDHDDFRRLSTTPAKSWRTCSATLVQQVGVLGVFGMAGTVGFAGQIADQPYMVGVHSVKGIRLVACS